MAGNPPASPMFSPTRIKKTQRCHPVCLCADVSIYIELCPSMLHAAADLCLFPSAVHLCCMCYKKFLLFSALLKR